MGSTLCKPVTECAIASHHGRKQGEASVHATLHPRRKNKNAARVGTQFHRTDDLGSRWGLEKIPEGLVVDLVVELHLGAFDYRPQLAWRTIGGSLLQVGITALHVAAEDGGDPLRGLEVLDGRLNVVG